MTTELALLQSADTNSAKTKSSNQSPVPVVTTWICLLQVQDVDLESSGDVLVLSPVSRKDSGIYQCHPLDTNSFTEVKGEMQLTVHCEESHTHTHEKQT